MINSLSTGDTAPTDDTNIIVQGVGNYSDKFYRKPVSLLWNYIKSKLATVATSGSYNDLSNKPTIPSVGNGTITIKQAGTSKGTFTMNQSGNTTIELTDNNTTYGVATSSTLGLVKSGTDITVDSNGNVSVNDDSHNHVISNVDGLQSALDSKSDLSHTHNYLPLSGGTVIGATQFNNYLKLNAWTNYGTGTANFWYDANNKFVEIQNATDLKLAGTKVSKEGHTHSNYVNQNAFSNVVVGSTTVAADSATDTLTLVAGSNITLTPDATNDKITIAATDTNTWRGIQNNLTSDSATDSLSAKQGKALKALIDGKADKSHGNHVPTTQTANNAVFLRNDNTWQTVTPANIGAAPSSHGTHVPSVCTTITDWNNATTNGWYMAHNASNQPVSNAGWFYGITIAHNSSYIRQIAWHFADNANVAGTNCDRYERVKHNGTWGSWVNTSVRVAVPSDAKFTDNDTKNTAGSTNTSSKIFLVGATSQAANPQTYSHDTVYVGTDGCLYSNSTKVSVEGHTHSNKADYETGTWSPTISNSSVSCLEEKSPYVKIGSIVLLWTVVDVNTTNSFGVKGFPISVKSMLSACIFDIDASDDYNSGKLIRDGSAYHVYFQCPTGCKRIFIIYSC